MKNSKVEPIGIKRLEGIHWYVHDLERSRRFYCENLDFAEIGSSSKDLEKWGKQKSAVFQAGQCAVIISQPVGEGGRAWRYLKKHPDGIGSLIFEVKDIEKTFRLLESRGGTPITDIETIQEGNKTFRTFSITTPFGDTTIRFTERKNYSELFPGFEAYPSSKGGKNCLGFSHFDHITSNFQTMSPAILWMENVLGLQKFWEIQFHTNDVKGNAAYGSGLRSIVMWDPESKVKFANNEPWRPNFKQSQINIFNEDQRGDGVQHVAIAVKEIIPAVEQMRKKGLEFMSTPGAYYDKLPERMKKVGVNKIDEEMDVLRRLEILVDGDSPGNYLLQIFLKDAAGLYREPKAGPFFYEIIQRKGNEGFGEGNFRALFDSIEDEQVRGRRM